MAIGQGGYTGNLEDIVDALGPQSGTGEFIENYMRTPATWDIQKAEAQWGSVKQGAKDVGTSIMDWLGATAFKGSQNPTGIVQEAVGALSYPFRKTAEVAFDYINPYSPGGYMHSEQMPNFLSALNENLTLRTGLAKNPAIAAAPALLGGIGIGVNKWAEGEDVLKGDVVAGVGSLAGPIVGLTAKGLSKAVQKVAPDLTDEMVDQTKRGLLKAATVGTGLIAAPIIATKAILRKGGKPVVKATTAVLGKIAVITGRLNDAVTKSLRTVLAQTPLDVNQAMKVEDLYPSRAAGGTNITEDLGYQPGVTMSRTLESADNQGTIGFFEDVIKADNKLADLVKYQGKSLDKHPTYPDVLKDAMYGVHRRSDLVDETLHVGGASPHGDVPFYDDIAESIARNLDAVDEAESMRSLQRILGDSEEFNLSLAGKSTANVPSVLKGKQVDRFLEYHRNHIGHVSRAQEKMVYGSDLIEHLAKTNPEHLATIMRTVITKAEKNLALPANYIDESGRMVRVDHTVEQFKLDTAKEILEALIGG